MLLGAPAGTTRIVGKSQGYAGLAIRDEKINCTVNGPNTPAMVTAWFPTPAEIEAMHAGAPIHVRIIGNIPPPMMVMVGEVPAEELPEIRG